MTEERQKESYLSDEEVEVYCKKYLESFSKVDAYLAVHPNSTRISALANITRYHSNPKIQEYLSSLLIDNVMGIDEIFTRLSELARDKGNKQAQLKALELLGRTKALFLDRTDITSRGEKLSWNEFINQKTTEESK